MLHTKHFKQTVAEQPAEGWTLSVPTSTSHDAFPAALTAHLVLGGLLKIGFWFLGLLFK